MPVPSYRVPVRVARGTKAALTAGLADLQEGELCYATDENALYVIEGGSLTSATVDLTGIQIVNDTAPQLGGNLDTNSFQIISTAAGNIQIAPDTTGVLEVMGNTGNDAAIQLNCETNTHGIKLKAPPHSAGASYTLVFPDDTGASGQALTTDGTGVMSWTTPSTVGSIDDLSDVTVTSPADDHVLVYNATNAAWENVQFLNGAATLIQPFAFARVNNGSGGTGVGMTYGAFDGATCQIDVTFATAQGDTEYTVVTDTEAFDEYFVAVSNKTTTGFTVEHYDSNSTCRNPSSFPFSLQVYASDPTIVVGGTGAAVLDDLADVDTVTAAPTDGQALIWDNANSEWVPGDVATDLGTTSIDALQDVDTTTAAPTDGQALVWDNANSEWVPGDVAPDLATTSIDALQDVDTTTAAPTNNQVLAWDGTNWVPADQSGGGGGGGGSSAARLTEAQTAASGIATFVGIGHSGTLVEVTSSLDAWIVLYDSAASRTADNGRAYNTDPASGSGVLAEFYITAGTTVLATPGTTYFNNDTSVTEAVYAAVRDQAGADVNSQVTIVAYGNQTITSVSGGTFGSGV